MPALTDEKKTCVEALLVLGEASFHGFDERRKYEWKVNFVLWTALGVVAGLQYRGELKLTFGSAAGIAVIILMSAIGLVYTFVWAPGLFKRNQRDVSHAHWYWNEVESMLCIESPRRAYDKTPRPGRWKNWSFFSEITFTWIMALLVLASLFSK